MVIKGGRLVPMYSAGDYLRVVETGMCLQIFKRVIKVNRRLRGEKCDYVNYSCVTDDMRFMYFGIDELDSGSVKILKKEYEESKSRIKKKQIEEWHKKNGEV